MSRPRGVHSTTAKWWTMVKVGAYCGVLVGISDGQGPATHHATLGTVSDQQNRAAPVVHRLLRMRPPMMARPTADSSGYAGGDSFAVQGKSRTTRRAFSQRTCAKSHARTPS